jgi:hypothetical protein
MTLHWKGTTLAPSFQLPHEAAAGSHSPDAPQSAWISTTKVLGVALASFIAMLALNFYAHGVDKTLLTGRIVSAFHDRELTENVFSANDLRRGINQFNDCLILQSTLLTHGDRAIDRVIDSASALVLADEAPCVRLKALAEQGVFDRARLYDYNRYLWGAGSLAAIALQLVSLRTLRLTVEIAVYALFSAAFFGGILYPRKRPGAEARIFGYSIAILSATFLTLYALHYFAPNIGHGFSELVIASFLFSRLVSGQVRNRHVILVIGLFGAWTAYFELLSGPFVIGFLVTGILCIIEAGSMATQSSTRSTLRKTGADIAFYCLGFTAVMLLQQIMASLLTASNTFKDFWIHIAIRLQLHHALGTEVPKLWQTESNMASYTPVDVFLAVWTALPNLTFDSHTAAYVLSVLAFLMACAGMYLAFISRVARYRAQVAAMALLLLVVPVWYLVFSNHTVIHAFGMVRLLAAPWAMSAIIFFIGVVALRESRNAAIR